MATPRHRIEQVAARLGKADKARTVILFGPDAAGNPGEESDVDSLAIAESRLPRHKRSRQLYALFEEYPFPMDILVYAPSEVEAAIRTPGSFVARIMAEGRELYVVGR